MWERYLSPRTNLFNVQQAQLSHGKRRATQWARRGARQLALAHLLWGGFRVLWNLNQVVRNEMTRGSATPHPRTPVQTFAPAAGGARCA